MKNGLTFLIFPLLCFVFASCGNQNAYKNERDTLDSLLTEVNNAEEVFRTIDVKQNVKMAKTVKNALKTFQNEYKGDLELKQATQFSQFKDIASGLKNFDKKAKHINTELKRTKSQLGDLIGAIDANAEVDKLGNAMDKAYMDKHIAKEKEMAESLVSGIYDLKERADKGALRYKTEVPSYLNLMDSLTNAQ